jgi:hypothetical protein
MRDRGAPPRLRPCAIAANPIRASGAEGRAQLLKVWPNLRAQPQFLKAGCLPDSNTGTIRASRTVSASQSNSADRALTRKSPGGSVKLIIGNACLPAYLPCAPPKNRTHCAAFSVSTEPTGLVTARSVVAGWDASRGVAGQNTQRPEDDEKRGKRCGHGQIRDHDFAHRAIGAVPDCHEITQFSPRFDYKLASFAEHPG